MNTKARSFGMALGAGWVSHITLQEHASPLLKSRELHSLRYSNSCYPAKPWLLIWIASPPLENLWFYRDYIWFLWQKFSKSQLKSTNFSWPSLWKLIFSLTSSEKTTFPPWPMVSKFSPWQLTATIFSTVLLILLTTACKWQNKSSFLLDWSNCKAKEKT